ncbi:MAG: glycosyltransferase [Bacteroidota bacterium]
MKILFLTRWYLPYAGIFIERHAQAVAMYNDLVVLAVLPREKSSGLKPVVEPRTGAQSFHVIRYFFRPSDCRIAVIAGLINNLRFLINALAGYRYVSQHHGSPDLIHVHVLTRAALPAFLLNLFTAKPYIVSEHWSRYIPESRGYRGFARKLLTRMIVRRAAAITTVSGYLKSAMQDCGLRNKRFMVIPNAIDTSLFKPAGNRVAKEKKRILHVSTFTERSKNIHGILRVISILRQQRHDFEILFIGGDEPALGEARRYATSLGLDSPDVIFSGPKPAEELADIYRESSFLLMFSNFESFSIVIPEALASGIPVLATAAGGIPEYFRNYAGRMIPPGDETALLENLHYMLDHYTSFDPEYLAGFIENRFGLKEVGGQFDKLYRSL